MNNVIPSFSRHDMTGHATELTCYDLARHGTLVRYIVHESMSDFID